MNIARIVKTSLKQQGRSQTWLAERLGVSRQQVSMFLSGKSGMSVPLFMKMLTVLRLEIRPKSASAKRSAGGR